MPVLVYENLYRPFAIDLANERYKSELKKIITNEEFKKSERFDSRLKKLQGKDIKTYSSGRSEIWMNSLNIVFNQRYFFGFGPQADRYLLSKYAKK